MSFRRWNLLTLYPTCCRLIEGSISYLCFRIWWPITCYNLFINDKNCVHEKKILLWHPHNFSMFMVWAYYAPFPVHLKVARVFSYIFMLSHQAVNHLVLIFWGWHFAFSKRVPLQYYCLQYILHPPAIYPLTTLQFISPKAYNITIKIYMPLTPL